MIKTNILFLKPGATVSLNGTEVGYTRGITFTPDMSVTHLTNQRVPGFVSSVLTSISGQFEVNLLEFSHVNLDRIFMDGLLTTLGSYIIIIKGVNKENPGKTMTLTLNNATLESVGQIKFDGREEATLPLTFQCLLDADGKMGTLTLA